MSFSAGAVLALVMGAVASLVDELESALVEAEEEDEEGAGGEKDVGGFLSGAGSGKNITTSIISRNTAGSAIMMVC